MRYYTPSVAFDGLALPQAAVLLAITDAADPHLVLTQRASHLSTHSGEVAFPGGRRDPHDQHLGCTALREAQEEIGLPPEKVEVLGNLSPIVSRYGMVVTPYVGIVPEHLEYVLNQDEIAALFTVPLNFFRDDPRMRTHRIDYQGQVWYVPSYTYRSFTIWGLTAIMIVELVNLLFDCAICLHTAPSSAS